MGKRKDNLYCVYCHTLKQDGRKYFGATGEYPSSRWANGKGHSYGGEMRKAIDTYGWESFEHEIIEDNLSEEQAYELEIALIKQHNTTNIQYGFNKSIGGKSSGKGVKKTEKQRKIISERQKGHKRSEEFCEKMRQINLGYKHSDETKEKLRQINLGKKHSKETKEKISNANKGRPNHMKGKKYTEDGKKNMGAKVGHKVSKETTEKIAAKVSKPVLCVETGIIYKSAREIERQLGIDYKLISLCCNGRCKTAKGFHWKFYESEVKIE